MHKLRPTLWRTCRAIACETRLALLWTLFEEKEMCVALLAKRVGMGEAQASIQLRSLNARGLIVSRREKMRVIYRPEANAAVDFAPELLEGLLKCHERNMALETVIRQATAFTHQRRIEIVRALTVGNLDWDGLLRTTGMSTTALARHINKLKARGFITKTDSQYMLTRPANRFGCLLLRIACS